MFVIQAFRAGARRMFSQIPEEGIMPKLFLKSFAVRTCALACVAGLSINTFAFAGSSNSTASLSLRRSTRTLMPSQNPSPTPPARPGISPGKDNQAMQADQGKRYGQSGFVGEPINLNVVNADIRDTLNSVTEQYGINFVIDSSVGAVPVTVNVQDVPWNLALDALLRANKLGVEVNGNILRVATAEMLAKEAEVQKVITDARLDNSPLVTEFIRLNYARASGTLAQAAGSTGGFSGGATNLSFSGGAGGDATGGSGDQGVLPIIKRRLSRRGSIEVDGRSNTLIVTDVVENIAAIRQLVAILDQPEPQVEIETRIVIAQHNFSRDLGSQLSFGVANMNRGGIANVSSLPASGSTGSGGSGGTGQSPTVNSGPNPFSAFGGVPGIDTQRMQSEVLVPDGGTTVMGGVLADTESTTRQRTPGLANMPILGNMFKRKQTSKDSTEILFFITPHIYRPDYFGKPMVTTPTSGQRTQSVPQPVPLGNPSSNTPTPTELQQQQGEKPQMQNQQPNVLGSPSSPAP